MYVLFLFVVIVPVYFSFSILEGIMTITIIIIIISTRIIRIISIRSIIIIITIVISFF